MNPPPPKEISWGKRFATDATETTNGRLSWRCRPSSVASAGDVRRHEKTLWETARFLGLGDLDPTEDCWILWDCWCKPSEDLAQLREDARKGCA